MDRNILMIGVVALLAGNSFQSDIAKDDLQKMIGNWTLVSTETNGKKRTAADFKVFSRKVTGETYSVTIESEEGVQTIDIKITKLDPTKSPKAINVKMTEGPAKGKAFQGIYKFEDDTQVLCLAAPDNDRPTKFDPKEGTVTVWKRANAPAKNKVIAPDLSQIHDSKFWRIINADCETVKEDGKLVVRLQPKGKANTPSDIGLALVEGLEFTEGAIEIDLKGQGTEKRIFLGVAFAAVDGKTFEAVYFRPFNFMADDKPFRERAVQYVAWPDHNWEKLRQGKPGVYEAAVKPIPDPSGWFHARIEVNKKVSVWIDDAKEPCLVVDRLSNRETGKVGLWVDSRGGAFANLKVLPAKHVPRGQE
jgi:uncharacterized protein (TIGR03067 family)